MTNQLKTEIEKINKGCQGFIEEDDFEDPQDLFDHDIYCGTKRVKDNKLMLCPSCKSKKQGLIQGAKIMIEEIKSKIHKTYSGDHNDNIDELLKQLNEEINNELHNK